MTPLKARTPGEGLVHKIAAYIAFFREREPLYQLIKEADFISPSHVQKLFDLWEILFFPVAPEFFRVDSRMSANFLMGLAHHLSREVLHSEIPVDLVQILKELKVLFSEGLKIS
jgi:hypothetical protein